MYNYLLAGENIDYSKVWEIRFGNKIIYSIVKFLPNVDLCNCDIK